APYLAHTQLANVCGVAAKPYQSFVFSSNLFTRECWLVNDRNPNPPRIDPRSPISNAKDGDLAD
ncbi:hypothetical protein MAR_020485, partial [Mya arenaria]